MRSPVFVTPHFKNLVKSSVPSSLNVNHTFSERTISKDFRTPQDFGFGEFFGIFLKNYFENQKIIVKNSEILL